MFPTSRSEKILQLLETKNNEIHCETESTLSGVSLNDNNNFVSFDSSSFENIPIIIYEEPVSDNFSLENLENLLSQSDGLEESSVSLELDVLHNIEEVFEVQHSETVSSHYSDSFENDNDPDYEPDTIPDDANEPETNDNDDNGIGLEEDNTPRVADYGNMQEGRKRRKYADSSEWKRNKNKELRMKGKAYVGFTRDENKVFQHNTMREERKLGLTCTSKKCQKSDKRNCNQFSEEIRKEIFETFWEKLNWDQRKIYVCSHVQSHPVSRSTTLEESSRRHNTLDYSLSNKNKKLPVCRKMFLNTLSLGAYTVQDWVKGANCGMQPETNYLNVCRKNTNHRVHLYKNSKKYLNDFFQKLPKQPSHYVRKDSNKLYLEEYFRSMKQLFERYEEECVKDNVKSLGRFVFEKYFKINNLSLFNPKKDRCNLCIEHEHGNLDDEVWKKHDTNKKRIRQENENDKVKAEQNEIVMISMDLQAVKTAPHLNATAIYFKTKLSCHNFTLFNVGNHDCTCYWFTEIDTDLCASTFVSCILNYLEENYLHLKIPIVLYSDGCTFQNRNAILANALLNFSMLHGVSITQKFFEKGHSQMEVDSVHSCIERKLKNRKIYLPSDFLRATEEARRSKPGPYKCKQVDHTFFNNYTLEEHHRYKTIRPGKNKNDPQVTDLKMIQYSPDGVIKVKIDCDDQWIDLPCRIKKIDKIKSYPKMHQQKLKISRKKWNHLQELKKVIPKDCHAFYDMIPTET